MDKEFLQDYEENENYQIKLFHKKYKKDGKIGEYTYPPRNRFKKIKDPIGRAIPLTSILPLIPLYGSLIIPLTPTPESDATKLGFESSDVRRLVDFCKDTGRIQFVLSSDATAFEGYDYLDPIFKELQPPKLATIPADTLLSEKERTEFGLEFLSFAESYKFQTYLEAYLARFSFRDQHFKTTMGNYMSDYSILRKLGYDEILEEININLVNNAVRAAELLAISSFFIVNPIIDVSKHIRNYSTEFPFNIQMQDKKNEEKYPFEIGKFLIKNISIIPESFEAVIDIIGKYEQEDMYKVFNKLNESIKASDIDLVNITKDELNTIMENVWKDDTLKRRANYLEYGLPIGLAAIGTIVGGITGGVGGLLAGLGINVVDKIISPNMDSITNNIVKYTVPSYLCGIHDFKNKYKIA